MGLRRAEAQEACGLVGFARHESLVNDLEVFYEGRTLAKLAALVRRVAPDLLLTQSPSDYGHGLPRTAARQSRPARGGGAADALRGHRRRGARAEGGDAGLP